MSYCHSKIPIVFFRILPVASSRLLPQNTFTEVSCWKVIKSCSTTSHQTPLHRREHSIGERSLIYRKQTSKTKSPIYNTIKQGTNLPQSPFLFLAQNSDPDLHAMTHQHWLGTNYLSSRSSLPLLISPVPSEEWQTGLRPFLESVSVGTSPPICSVWQ